MHKLANSMISSENQIIADIKLGSIHRIKIFQAPQFSNYYQLRKIKARKIKSSKSDFFRLYTLDDINAC